MESPKSIIIKNKRLEIKFMQEYSFHQKKEEGKHGVEIATNYLLSLEETLGVNNFESSRDKQMQGIDLIWKHKFQDSVYTSSIEVKIDNHKTGYMFLETISDEENEKDGCFVSSEADFLFYIVKPWDIAYKISLPNAQNWFYDNKNRFKERRTFTRIAGKTHMTVGKLVPIDVLCREVLVEEINL